MTVRAGEPSRSRRAGSCLAVSVLLASLGSTPSEAQRAPAGHARDDARTFSQDLKQLAIWTLSEERSIGDVDAVDGPMLLVDVVAAALLDDRRLLVGDGSSSELRVFALADGRHLSTIARRGSGPGEISDLWSVWFIPTAIVAEDGSGRASIFDRDGAFRRQVPRAVDSTARRVERVGMIDEEHAVGTIFEPAPTVSVGETDMQWLRVAETTPTSSRTLFRYPARVLRRGRSGRPRPDIFSAQTVVAVVGSRVCAGHPDRWRVDCYDRDGQHLSRAELGSARAQVVTPIMRANYIAREVAANPGPEGQRYGDQLRRSARFAESLPLFGEFVPTPSGELWVGPFVPPQGAPAKRTHANSESLWIVLDSDGRPAARVRVPARVQLLSATSSRAVGVARDELDRERVVVYRIAR